MQWRTKLNASSPCADIRSRSRCAEGMCFCNSRVFSHIPKSEPPVLIDLTTKSVKTVVFEPPAAVDLVLCSQGCPLADGPRSSPDGPRSSPDGPRSSTDGPRSSTDGPRSSTDGPWSSTDGTRSSTDGPRSSTDGPRSSTDGPKFSPSNDGPESSTDGHGPGFSFEAIHGWRENSIGSRKAATYHVHSKWV